MDLGKKIRIIPYDEADIFFSLFHFLFLPLIVLSEQNLIR